MPKAEIGSVKDIGKRIKAKGLQKLKFYCQVCQKQCRDANGFKCHITSENHLRQMKIFSDNASGYMDQYSKTFEKIFLDTLRYKHSTVKVNANNVYQEVIRDKQHIHMNSTIWTTLTDFVKYLGKVGKCIVEENHNTPGGWYITYIERDATKIQRQEQYEQRVQNEQQAEQLYQEKIQQQRIAASQELINKFDVPIEIKPSNILRKTGNENDDNHNIQLNFDPKRMNEKQKKIKGMALIQSVFDNEDEDDDEHNNDHDENTKTKSDDDTNQKQQSSNTIDNQNDNNSKDHKKKRRRWDDVVLSDNGDESSLSLGKRQKDNKDHDDVNDNDDGPWLYRDIIVRIITKQLGDGIYYRQKAMIDKVHKDGYTADIIMMDDDQIKIRIDQDDLETVTPKEIGTMVRIVKGPYRKSKAIVLELNKKKYEATLQIKDSLSKKNDNDDSNETSPILLHHVSYNDFSMMA